MALALLMGAGGAHAQFDLQVLDNGKPVPEARVTVVDDGQRTTLPGSTDASGSFDLSVLDFGKGTRLEVWRRRCQDGRVELVLAEEGTTGACVEEGQQAGERCTCEKLGTFVVGDGPVRVDVGRGVVAQGPSGGPDGGLRVGVGLDVRQMLELENVLGAVPDVVEEEGTAWAPGVQVFVEYPFFDGILDLGVEAAYSRMDTETRFADGGVQTGELDYKEVGVYARVGPRRSNGIRPYGILEKLRAWNSGTFVLDGDSQEREHVTWRDGLGAGVELQPRDRLGVRIEALYNTTFEDGDADEHIRWKLGLDYRPFGPE